MRVTLVPSLRRPGVGVSRSRTGVAPPSRSTLGSAPWWKTPIGRAFWYSPRSSHAKRSRFDIASKTCIRSPWLRDPGGGQRCPRRVRLRHTGRLGHVYLGVLNEPARPYIPVLSARIETDWYPQNTEFRYSMQPGDVLVASGGALVGQVRFAPRETVSLAPAAEEDVRAFVARQEQF